MGATGAAHVAFAASLEGPNGKQNLSNLVGLNSRVDKTHNSVTQHLTSRKRCIIALQNRTEVGTLFLTKTAPVEWATNVVKLFVPFKSTSLQ